MLPEFKAFQKIPRLSRPITITEKIDGTNAVVYIDTAAGVVQAGSRHRWIEPGKGTDNFGFAAWVKQWDATLVEVLGDGLHHGEWWGQGIQRGYGLDHKRFSLFHPKHYGAAQAARDAKGIPLYTVPVVAEYDDFWTWTVYSALDVLQKEGSLAAPGYMRPEGVVVFHSAQGYLFKKTIEGDERPKGSSE